VKAARKEKEDAQSPGDASDEDSVEDRTLVSKVLIEEVHDVDMPLPRTVKEAFSGPEAEDWRKAIEEELDGLMRTETWTLEDLPRGREAIGCRWVFSRKMDDKGIVIRYKARLVAQGFSQKPGMDFDIDQTYTPVMRLESLRTSLALSVIFSLIPFQLDVKNAYLNGHLDEELYMRQPPGFEDDSGRVCRLKRSLYGLKQAGNVWNREFNSAMEDLGFKQLKTDYCCYIRRYDGHFSMLLLWVDDILGFANSNLEKDRVCAEIGKKFKITVIGRPNMLLGMKITQNEKDRTITLSQTHYIDSLLKRFGLEDANPVTTPLDLNVDLDSLDPPPITEDPLNH
jgi:hypothetical protein